MDSHVWQKPAPEGACRPDSDSPPADTGAITWRHSLANPERPSRLWAAWVRRVFVPGIAGRVSALSLFSPRPCLIVALIVEKFFHIPPPMHNLLGHNPQW